MTDPSTNHTAKGILQSGEALRKVKEYQDQVFSHWLVTYGEGLIVPCEQKPLTRLQALKNRVLSPWYRLRYATEDFMIEARYRISGAWGVLIGRDQIL